MCIYFRINDECILMFYLALQVIVLELVTKALHAFLIEVS